MQYISIHHTGSTSKLCVCLGNSINVLDVPTMPQQQNNEMELSQIIINVAPPSLDDLDSSGESIIMPQLLNDLESSEQSSYRGIDKLVQSPRSASLESRNGSDSPIMEMLNSPAMSVLGSPIPVVEMPDSQISVPVITEPSTSNSQLQKSANVPVADLIIEELSDDDCSWQLFPKNKPKTRKSSSKRKKSSKKISFGDSDDEPLASSQSKIFFSKDGQMFCKKYKK